MTTPEERMRSQLWLQIGYMEGLAMRMDDMVQQTKSGGWSTHQVAAQTEIADQLRRMAANARRMMNEITPELDRADTTS